MATCGPDTVIVPRTYGGAICTQCGVSKSRVLNRLETWEQSVIMDRLAGFEGSMKIGLEQIAILDGILERHGWSPVATPPSTTKDAAPTAD